MTAGLSGPRTRSQTGKVFKAPRVVRDSILKIISEAGLNNPPAEVVDVKVPGEAQAGKPFKHVFKNNCVNIVCPEDARPSDTIKVVMTTGRGMTNGKPTEGCAHCAAGCNDDGLDRHRGDVLLVQRCLPPWRRLLQRGVTPWRRLVQRCLPPWRQRRPNFCRRLRRPSSSSPSLRRLRLPPVIW